MNQYSQIKAFVQTLTTAKKDEPISESTKYQYTQNIKTMMECMNKTNLDFLVTDIPGVIDFLNKTDTPTESRIAYNTRLTSRNFFTVATVFLPLAKTNDPNDRIVAKNQYNVWLEAHPFIKKPGKSKEYGMTCVEAVKKMQSKIKNTKNELHNSFYHYILILRHADQWIILRYSSINQMTIKTTLLFSRLKLSNSFLINIRQVIKVGLKHETLNHLH